MARVPSDQPALDFLSAQSSVKSIADYAADTRYATPASSPSTSVSNAKHPAFTLSPLDALEAKIAEKKNGAAASPLPDLSERVLRVGEFLDLINEIMKPLRVRIRGEISSISERENAFYLNLSDGTEQAVVNCVLWRGDGRFYREILKEGTEIEVLGSANIYKPYGKFSLIIKSLQPVGEGVLRQAFEALKRQLAEEGYFAPERKREIPPFITKIGLITSEFGDARKDFLTHLGNNGQIVYFRDVRVEGVNAIDSIVEAIKWFNMNRTDIEVLVLTRGGGSLESLQAFNSLEVARTIFASRIPIISAVGHENDVSISDLVADLRASTPTHAGKILSEPWNTAREKIEFIDVSISRGFQMAAAETRRKIESGYERSLASFSTALHAKRNTLAGFGSGMLGHFRGIVSSFQRLEDALRGSEHTLSARLQETAGIIERQRQLIGSQAIAFHKRLTQRLLSAEQLLQISDPMLRLKQGYSITYNSAGRVVKSAADVKGGDIVTTQTARGKITSSVIKTILHDTR